MHHRGAAADRPGWVCITPSRSMLRRITPIDRSPACTPMSRVAAPFLHLERGASTPVLAGGRARCRERLNGVWD